MSECKKSCLRGGGKVGSEYETRKNDKSVLFRAYEAQEDNDFESFILWQQSQMSADDVKLVKQEFEKRKKKS
jgi:hypothetical protein